MDSCIFCKIIAGEMPSYKVYEDEKTIAILDINPIARGHTLIIPKVHSETLYDIQVEDAGAVGATVSRVTKAVKQVLKCDGVNVYQANEKIAMQVVMHVHFHVIPRFEGDDIVFMAQKSELREEPDYSTELKSVLNGL
ncbi:MAG: HIT family protein [Candidatus Hodarchaeales archaeon]|jgi:histidine triad (HIT) family protein